MILRAHEFSLQNFQTFSKIGMVKKIFFAFENFLKNLVSFHKFLLETVKKVGKKVTFFEKKIAFAG